MIWNKQSLILRNKQSLLLRNNEVWSHLLVTFIYFFIVSVLRWKFDLNLIGLWLGAFLGTFLLDIDHVIYWFVTHPEKDDSRQAQLIWKEKGTKGLKELFEVLRRYHIFHDRLIFHSALGQIILLILGVYIVSSGGNILGSGIIISMNLHLLKDEFFSFKTSGKEGVKSWLFWQINDLRIGQYIREYLIGVAVIFVLLTLLLIKGI